MDKKIIDDISDFVGVVGGSTVSIRNSIRNLILNMSSTRRSLLEFGYKRS